MRNWYGPLIVYGSMKLGTALLFYILFLTCSDTKSQSIELLDANGIFEGFHLGDSPNQFDGDITLDLTISYGISYYKYHGKLVNSFEGFKTHSINLGFLNNTLNYIDLYFKGLDDDAFQHLLSRLETRYGLSTPFDALDRGVTNSVEWQGEQVTLQLYRFNENTIDLDDRNMTVFMLTTKAN